MKSTLLEQKIEKNHDVTDHLTIVTGHAGIVGQYGFIRKRGWSRRRCCCMEMGLISCYLVLQQSIVTVASFSMTIHCCGHC